MPQQLSDAALRRQRELASYSSAPTHYRAPAVPVPQPELTHNMPQATSSEPLSAPTSSSTDDAPEGGGNKRELPPALKARLQARGILRLAQAASESSPSTQIEAAPIAAVPQAGHFAASAYAVPDNTAAASSGTPPAAEPPLPPGWFGSMDPTYHRVYFYNPTTGERTWERPLPGLPLGWAEAKDPTSGVTYYYNAGTGGPGLAFVCSLPALSRCGTCLPVLQLLFYIGVPILYLS